MDLFAGLKTFKKDPVSSKVEGHDEPIPKSLPAKAYGLYNSSKAGAGEAPPPPLTGAIATVGNELFTGLYLVPHMC